MAGQQENQLLSDVKYPHYLPNWSPNHDYPPLKPFEHHDHAKDADPAFPHLTSSAEIKHLTPFTGSVVSNIQLSNLTGEAKDELALLVAQRKVVILRSQDFKDLPLSSIVDFCKYFGPPVVHAPGPYLQDWPEIHVAHKSVDDTRFRDISSTRTNSINWHADSSASRQPPGMVFLYMLECPDLGGDTIFTNTAEAYRRLSPAYAKRLHGLRAEHKVHSGLTGVHPVVRTHPVTGEKCLFINPLYTSHIIGYKKEESEALLRFLYDHITYSQDCQVRVQWTDDTVVIFDNRATAHSATFDFNDDRRRLLARVAPAAEEPYETPFQEQNGV